MIANELNKKPIISFGLGLTMISCSVGDAIPVNLNNLYNENEFIVTQNETVEIITLVYKTFASPTIQYTAFFERVGIYNNRHYYLNTTTFRSNVYIFWNGNKWLIVNNLDIVTGAYTQVVGINNTNSPYPVFLNWLIGGTSILPRSTTINININTFTFQATVTKDIQIEIKQKDSNTVIKSNIIKLIVL